MVDGLETQVFWPNKAQLITFEGLEFLLQPAISEGQHRSLPAIIAQPFSLNTTLLKLVQSSPA